MDESYTTGPTGHRVYREKEAAERYCDVMQFNEPLPTRTQRIIWRVVTLTGVDGFVCVRQVLAGRWFDPQS